MLNINEDNNNTLRKSKTKKNKNEEKKHENINKKKENEYISVKKEKKLKSSKEINDNKDEDNLIITDFNNEIDNNNHILMSFSSEKDDDENEIDIENEIIKEKKPKKIINSKSTRMIRNKNSNTNELSTINENNSIIKVKRVNNKKRVYDIGSQFQISQRVNNLVIYSQRENRNYTFNNNIISPGNIISFEYNISQRKQNNTSKIQEKEEKTEVKNSKLNNISYKDENEIKVDNNKCNVIMCDANNIKNTKKTKKKFCLCCL